MGRLKQWTQGPGTHVLQHIIYTFYVLHTFASHCMANLLFDSAIVSHTMCTLSAYMIGGHNENVSEKCLL